MRTIKLLLLSAMLVNINSVCAISTAKMDILAAKSIYKVIPPDKLKFELMRPDKEMPVNPILYGDDVIPFKEIECMHSSAFDIYSYANIMGSIKLAVCSKELISKTTVEKMEVNVNAFVSRHMVDMSRQELHDSGLGFEKSRLENGDEIYYLPVVVMGHGMLVVRTLVLFSQNSSQVFILQFYPEELCSTPERLRENRLCEKGYASLIDIATTFMNDYINIK